MLIVLDEELSSLVKIGQLLLNLALVAAHSRQKGVPKN